MIKYHYNLWSSELTKLVSNAFLLKEYLLLTVYQVYVETGADIEGIKICWYDSRIGNKFLKASIGLEVGFKRYTKSGLFVYALWS